MVKATPLMHHTSYTTHNIRTSEWQTKQNKSNKIRYDMGFGPSNTRIQKENEKSETTKFYISQAPSTQDIIVISVYIFWLPQFLPGHKNTLAYCTKLSRIIWIHINSPSQTDVWEPTAKKRQQRNQFWNGIFRI